MADKFKNPARYRLDFIKENTFNRVWSLRMTRLRVILVSLAVVAGGAALIWVFFAYTPMRQLLPETLSGDLRNQYLEVALKLDSLEQAARINEAYIANVAAILNDEIPADSAMAAAAAQVALSDSLLAASELEKEYVRRYQEEERFNLSVLSPIAAEGMIFNSPVPAGTEIADKGNPATGVSFANSAQLPLAAVYRGTVLGVFTAADGTSTIVVQHPNDFVSVYSGLADVYTAQGRKVAAGQRLATSARGAGTVYELWHNGTALDPREYISF